jgi:hypothetical protein
MDTQNFILVDTSGSMWPEWDNVKFNLIELDSLLESKIFIFTNSEAVFVTQNLDPYLSYIEPRGLTNFVLILEKLLNKLEVGKDYNIHLFTDNCGRVNSETRTRIIQRLNLINNQSNVVFYGASDAIQYKLGLNSPVLDSINIVRNNYLDEYKQTRNLIVNTRTTLLSKN